MFDVYSTCKQCSEVQQLRKKAQNAEVASSLVPVQDITQVAVQTRRNRDTMDQQFSENPFDHKLHRNKCASDSFLETVQSWMTSVMWAELAEDAHLSYNFAWVVQDQKAITYAHT
eukprot:5302603-Amphidinium_carterae.1